MSFEYSFTYEEYSKANAKYMRKATSLQLAAGIVCACIIALMFVIVLISKYVFNDPLDDQLAYAKSTAFLYFLLFLCMVFFALVFVFRYSYKKAHENFFNYYNEDGLLRYRAELTDTEVVVSYKQNVAHLPLKGIMRTVEIKDCLHVLFNINSILIVKITDETRPLVDKLKSCVPTKKKKGSK